MPYIGKAAVSGLRKRFTFLATAGQTSISGSDANGQTLTFEDGNLVDVFLNGVRLASSDFTASNGSTIALSSGAIGGDILVVKAFVTVNTSLIEIKFDTTPQLGGNLDLNSNDITGTGDINITGTIQSSGNITGTLATAAQPNITSLGTLTGLTVSGDLTVNGTTTTINSTTLTVDDKNIELGSVSSPSDTTADGGGITLKGATDHTFNWVNSTDAWTSSEHLNLASGKEYKINGTSLKDVSETLTNKSGNVSMFTNDSNYITNTVSGDFTVDTSTLKVDSSNNRVGIGTTSPAHDLVVTSASGDATLQILCPTTSDSSRIFFGDSGDEDIGVLHYDHSTEAFRFNVNNSEKMRLESDGDLHADGNIVAYSTTVSDVALKSDITVIPNALDKLDEIRGVTFTRHNGKQSAGIIAQELEKVLPEAINETKLPLQMNDGKKYKTVEYDAIHGLLIQAIKELNQELNDLKNKT